ncbi:DUF2384 domain-containing protein [soil metagenome]
MRKADALQEAVNLLKLRVKVDSPVDLAPLIRGGLPSSVLVALSVRMGLSPAAMIGAVGLPPRTLARRLKEKQALSAAESERVLRIARALAQASETLGTVVKARHWLQKPNRALGGECPLRMLDTDVGANAVLEELGRIEHGVFA